MNQKQRDYVRKRIREIQGVKLAELKASYAKLTHTVRGEEARELLLAGKLKLKKSYLNTKNPHIHSTLHTMYDLEKYEKTPTATQTKRYEAKCAAVRQRCADVTDEIMLADDTTLALKHLKELDRLSTTI